MKRDTRDSSSAARGAWRRAAAASRQLRDAAHDLESDFPASLERLRTELSSENTLTVLLALRFLDVKFTAELVDEIVGMSLSHRYAGRAFETLSRLPRQDVTRLIPPAVWRTLETNSDDAAYSQLAGLLEYFDLPDALDELMRRARDSDDPDVRDWAE